MVNGDIWKVYDVPNTGKKLSVLTSNNGYIVTAIICNSRSLFL